MNKITKIIMNNSTKKWYYKLYINFHWKDDIRIILWTTQILRLKIQILFNLLVNSMKTYESVVLTAIITGTL